MSNSRIILIAKRTDKGKVEPFEPRPGSSIYGYGNGLLQAVADLYDNMSGSEECDSYVDKDFQIKWISQ